MSIRRTRTWRDWLFLLILLLLYLASAIVLGIGIARSADLRRGELGMLARVVQAESTGEPADGQRAIAWTVVNRLREPETYGRTITKIIQKPHQYAKPAPLDDTSEAYHLALLATLQALLPIGEDSSNGSTHFHRCDMRPAPSWARRMARRAVIGKHCFYRRD